MGGEEKKEERTLQVLFNAPCISLELREKDLIVEFIMLVFRVEMNMFSEGRMTVNVGAKNFFMLHNEENGRFGTTKEVMCGHIGCRKVIRVDDGMYSNLVREIEKRNKKLAKNNFNIDVEMFPCGDMFVNIILSEVKMYVKTATCLAMSKFFIEGLKNLDKQKRRFYFPEGASLEESVIVVKQRPPKPQQPSTMKVTFGLTKSLIIMEMRTRSDNCIAIEAEFAASYQDTGI